MNRLPALFLIPALMLAAGCANYRLGSTLPPDVRTVYMPTCLNQTDEPLLPTPYD